MSIVLLNLCGHISYGMNNEQLHEPSKWTRSQVERALKAFEIPTESVQIYGFNSDGVSGFSNSDNKIIAINERSHNFVQIITSFHEAAHIKDNANAKKPLYATCLTAGFLGGYASMLYKVLSFAEKAVMAKPKLAIPSLAGVCSGLVLMIPLGKLFHENIAFQWASEQAEYRANKMAVEKLITLNKSELEKLVKLSKKGLLTYLLWWQKSLEQKNGNQRIGGHPPARSEYKATKKILEKNGYEVRKFRPEDAPDDLVIGVTKNGKGPFMRVEHFYSKV